MSGGWGIKSGSSRVFVHSQVVDSNEYQYYILGYSSRL